MQVVEHLGEMREIAATQAGAGLTPALFEAMAEVSRALRGSGTCCRRFLTCANKGSAGERT